MSEFGTQYNGLQGFAYSATAIINALAQLNSTISSLTLNLPQQKVYFDNNGQTITNTSNSTITYTLNKGNCTDCVGFILQPNEKNSNSILLNGAIALKPGTIFVLTVEQNRVFNITTVTLNIEQNDSISYLPICVS
jgi:hypothetical protein